MKSGRRPGFTLDLDDDTAAQLEAFKATYIAKTKRQIISEALVAHIEEVCRQDKVREREFPELCRCLTYVRRGGG
jgi:hypothetical protein